MLPTTAELIRYLQLPAAQQDGTVLQALIGSVWAGGDGDDARALLVPYVQQPFAWPYAALLPLFERHGDAACAAALFAACCPGQELHPEAPPEVLSVLARLGHTATTPLLVRYAFGPAPYDVAKHAALGLLHVDCREYEDTIRAAIEATYDQNLFPEFVPALVCKLPHRAEMLAQLYRSGTEYCSTDCNAGIVLGFSLCGAEGAAYFQQALLSPAWEVHASGTGTRWYAYQGMLNLKLSFQQLYARIRQLDNPAELRYAVDVLLSLLALKVGPYQYRYAPEDFESFADLYPALFGWATPDHRRNLHDLAARVALEAEAGKLEELMALRLHQEMMLKNYTRPWPLALQL